MSCPIFNASIADMAQLRETELTKSCTHICYLVVSTDGFVIGYHQWGSGQRPECVARFADGNSAEQALQAAGWVKSNDRYFSTTQDT